MRKILLFFCLQYCLTTIAVNISGTLPVMYINTEEAKPIVDKVNYISATYYIDPMGINGIEAIGSKNSPLLLQIRGRGNYTWHSFDKKPYILKLNNRQPLLGMKKNKHFALLAHADKDYAFFRNTVAFEISRRLEMPYTPSQCPIELVLNGEYQGLYFLTETIRVDANRVNITEQADGEIQEELVTGGWLVEIDNNRDNDQIIMPVSGTDLEWFWITYHSPEVLSNEQTDYLYNQFETIIKSIYTDDKLSTDWENIIDITSLAKFYIIHEAVDQLEGFLGSCYLYKDLGDSMWKFGPVWDFGNAFNKYHRKDRFIYQDSPFPISIIREIAKFPKFQQEVQTLWDNFYPVKMGDIDKFISNFANQISAAALCDEQRWPKYGDSNVISSSHEVISILHSKLTWLNNQWSSKTGIDNNNFYITNNKVHTKIYDMSGRLIVNPHSKGLYIINEYLPNGSVNVKKIINR